MDAARRYRMTSAGRVHNLYPPAACQVDLDKTRQGTPAQLAVFTTKDLERCQRCEEAEKAGPIDTARTTRAQLQSKEDGGMPDMGGSTGPVPTGTPPPPPSAPGPAAPPKPPADREVGGA